MEEQLLKEGIKNPEGIVEVDPSDAFINVAEGAYPGWEKSMTRMGETWINKGRGLFAVFGGKVIEGKHWVMLALFRRSKIPDIGDIALAKKTFIGEDRDALLLLPGAKGSKYFSEIPNALMNTVRLVSCVEGDSLPKFF